MGYLSRVQGRGCIGGSRPGAKGSPKVPGHPYMPHTGAQVVLPCTWQKQWEPQYHGENA